MFETLQMPLDLVFESVELRKEQISLNKIEIQWMFSRKVVQELSYWIVRRC